MIENCRVDDCQKRLLVAALQAVIDDVNAYERANNLAPNPGRTECLDSVAYAKGLIALVSSPSNPE